MNKLQGFAEYVVYPFFQGYRKKYIKNKGKLQTFVVQKKRKKGEKRKDKEGKNTKQSREMQGSKFTEMTAIN